MIVMSIAGVDPSGGAGVLTDIKAFQAIGVYGCGIVTALTSQNPYKFFSTMPVPEEFIEEQIDSVMDSYDVEFIKTGMLYSPEIIKLVSKKITEYDLKAVVDPVMVATSGGDLTREDIAKAFNKYLLPLSVLTTPNVSEAEKLADIKISTKEDAIKASKMIKCNNIITGGHLDGVNTINIDGEISIVKQELIETDNLHGTGCNLSAAITAFLAKNNDLHTSILKALDYVYEGIKNGNYGTLIAKI
ncbi:MAG: bifunctional hydroxymethylpyrimidine kinase/phosphomethylpyrimidine kinase [Methanobrevibacter sp.]|uniref:bifunctional hydroxymethylpyrimidine kinase/phosphomethylpyrimidine kinase n=1 Tax=Methanobrevibacter sp. TaxID=66852 RepID=UPI00257EE213|nr:bifunctional hydroxymethylpyrimidine kinase/phosphomethylpyrimidine kinase [Methanobrevibacter sp.]MBR2665596.1 bifunctional hydroxymethylpyrimidine kinase/phosphomethylpyrimidine kinase [Methanobrevibacter sp.]MBR3197328.1 bifunctional hydroxymethylpyrimidine kinase/phosphomethylpyrimidine kinase [Methanobrevibacter sp.]MBR7051074.1 bifunctional hydroxymethylpyrimidine kinase/phosphomethylpyrimidine kinase [Methanobrevibacter sp.]